MTKSSKFLVGIAIIIGFVGIAVLLTYISLLGENRKIDDTVNGFFDQIKNKQYREVCLDLSAKDNKFGFSTPQQCSDLVFLFELSLLKHYDLTGKDNYEVEIKKNHFWYPIFHDRPVRVNISLTKQIKSAPSQALSVARIYDFVKRPFTIHKRKDPTFVKNLLTLERKDGVWTITVINVKENAIAGIYADLRDRLQNETYIRKTQNGISVEKFEINLKDMKPVDREMLNYNLQKLRDMIDKK